MGRRMLIVEDEPDVSDCLQTFFQQKGFSVEAVFSGEEALALLEQDSPDIILLDIMLPGLSGLEVLKRAKVRYPELRAVMVTAHDHLELRQEAQRYGACAFVTKPFDFSSDTWSPVLATV